MSMEASASPQMCLTAESEQGRAARMNHNTLERGNLVRRGYSSGICDEDGWRLFSSLVYESTELFHAALDNTANLQLLFVECYHCR